MAGSQGPPQPLQQPASVQMPTPISATSGARDGLAMAQAPDAVMMDQPSSSSSPQLSRDIFNASTPDFADFSGQAWSGNSVLQTVPETIGDDFDDFLASNFLPPDFDPHPDPGLNHNDFEFPFTPSSTGIPDRQVLFPIEMPTAPMGAGQIPEQAKLQQTPTTTKAKLALVDWFSTSNSGTAGGSLRTMPTPPLRRDSVLGQVVPSSASNCGCSTKAHAVLGKLVMDKQKSETHTLRQLEYVLSQNQTAMETTNAVLACPCAKDISSLFTLALVVFKTLGWYAAAASACHANATSLQPGEPANQPPLTVRLSADGLPGYELDGEDANHIVRQLVLSRLHQVQRVVKVLSQRLHAMAEREQRLRATGGGSGIDVVVRDLLFDDNPFDQTTSQGLAQGLEASMRARLYDLSQALLTALRDGVP
ncbi:hypothetical protein N0V95_007064 [Ascochyta clinopodiicola]|nr:hypothetical protein N0V95_007064 [Ascochyta clinopodiicola]